jgi:hypothetical protein
MWEFIPRLPTAYAWNNRPFDKYITLREVCVAIKMRNLTIKGEIIFPNPHNNPVNNYKQFGCLSHLQALLRGIKDKSTIKRICLYDVGFFRFTK